MKLPFAFLTLFFVSNLNAQIDTTNNEASFDFLKLGISNSNEISDFNVSQYAYHDTELRGLQGWWHLQGKSDSFYLNIEKPTAYFLKSDSIPESAYVSVLLQEDDTYKPFESFPPRIQTWIQFTHWEHEPMPFQTSDLKTIMGSKTYFSSKEVLKTTYLFKQLINSQLILETNDSTKQQLIFNKLEGKPYFKRRKFEKLQTIQPFVEGMWCDSSKSKCFWMKKPFNDSTVEIFSSGISFLNLNTDTTKAISTYNRITWEKDSFFVFNGAFFDYTPLKIKFLTKERLVLEDSSEVLSFHKCPLDIFPDSILRGIKNKRWGQLDSNRFEKRVDTIAFDFGRYYQTPEEREKAWDFYSGKGNNQWSFHSTIFLEFVVIDNRYFVSRGFHAGSDVVEILKITPQSLTVREFDRDKTEIKTYFLVKTFP